MLSPEVRERVEALLNDEYAAISSKLILRVQNPTDPLVTNVDDMKRDGDRTVKRGNE